jgi:hypothetical protein
VASLRYHHKLAVEGRILERSGTLALAREFTEFTFAIFDLHMARKRTNIVIHNFFQEISRIAGRFGARAINCDLYMITSAASKQWQC